MNKMYATPGSDSHHFIKMEFLEDEKQDIKMLKFGEFKEESIKDNDVFECYDEFWDDNDIKLEDRKTKRVKREEKNEIVMFLNKEKTSEDNIGEAITNKDLGLAGIILRYNGKNRLTFIKTNEEPYMVTNRIANLLDISGSFMIEGLGLRMHSLNVAGIKDMMRRITNCSQINVTLCRKSSGKRKRSRTEEIGSVLKTAPETIMTIPRHLKMKMRQNRLKFEGLFGTPFNVLSPVKVICPLCDNIIGLTNTGGLSPFRTHLKRTHCRSAIVSALLRSLTMKNPDPVTSEETLFIHEHPPTGFVEELNN